MSDGIMLLTESEAADLLKMSQKTLQKRRFLKKPPRFLSMNGVIRYRMSDLQEYMENSVVEPKQQEASHE